MLLPELHSISHRKTGPVFRSLFLLCLSVSLSPLPASAESEAYVPYSGIIRGTEGADPVEISVANRSDATISCDAALAHWYSDKLGNIAPGDELTLTLWHDKETGVLNLMNATEDRMPVEALWCASETARTRLHLPMAAGEARDTLRFACHTEDGTGLICDATGG